MKKKIIISLILLLSLLLLGYGLFMVSKSRTFQFFGTLVYKGDTNEKIVALTFDDAPTEQTLEVVKVLSERNVKATFYVIGEEAEKHPDTLRALVEGGHEVGNHSYSHQRMVLKSPAFIKNEIEKTNVLIRNNGYGGEITFRPPNGKKLLFLPWYLWRNNITTVMWNLEPDSFVSGDAEKIVSFTTETVKPGSIILIHPFCEKTCAADREALPTIIDKLKTDGYRFVTVSELLKK